MKAESFHKSERICSKQLVDQLFGGGNATFAAFPLRAVYMFLPTPSDPSAGQVGCAPDWPVSVPAQVLVSVSKRKFRHAVDRNRMKRQVREAYRRRKQPLWQLLESRGLHVAIAFICLSDQPCTTRQVCRSMDRILRRIQEQLPGEGKSSRCV